MWVIAKGDGTEPFSLLDTPRIVEFVANDGISACSDN